MNVRSTLRHRLRTIGGLAAIAVLAGGAVLTALNGTEDGGPMTASAAGKVRTFYIAADEVMWDYAPANTNLFSGEPFDDTANVFVQAGPERIGKTYLKSQYREYTDGSFNTLKPVPADWSHLGIVGPAIHAEVGDTIKFVFKNNTGFPASVHPHGVFYEKNSEGAPYNDGTTGANKADDAVAPGGTYTYTWDVPERSGPGPSDPSSVLWTYHSHTDEIADTNAGLVGPLIVTRKFKARADGSPADVDRELVTLFSVMNENASIYIDRNVDRLHLSGPRAATLKEDPGFQESNLMHEINGFVYGNLPGLTMRKGERVRWYTIGMGTEVDLHTPHWHGNTLLLMGMRMDMVELLPMSMKTLDMIPDNVGRWAFHCHVNDHLSAGMLALYTVLPALTAGQSGN